jgi:hypothetical protein
LVEIYNRRSNRTVFKNLVRMSLTVTALALLQQTAFAADVSVHQVYEAAQAGHLSEAQAMMQQVLREHPESGKAHFVEAELLARQGQLPAARVELATAERLAPGLPFAKPAAVQSLQARLSSQPMVQTVSPQRQHTPWGLMILGALLVTAVALFIRAMRRRTSLQTAPTVTGPGQSGPGGGYGSPGAFGGGGIGSGIVGGLATGAALGAGMVAGEALAHRLTGGEGRDERLDGGNVPAAPGNDFGDPDFGVQDDSSWDDSGGGDIGGGDWG